MDLHPLDLPNLRLKPSLEELTELLGSLKVNPRNFDAAPQLPPHLINWLVRFISADLDWLDPDQADILREQASVRVAQSCGSTATSSVTRIVDVGPLEFRLHEPGLVDDNIGHKTWGSCLIVAHRLLRQPELLHGNILELGSGTGLVGMVAAHLGHKALLTDLPAIVPNLQRNIDLNTTILKGECTSVVLDWSRPYAVPDIDTVLISDPVYSAAAPQQIADTLNVLKIRRILLQLPIRANFQDLRDDLYAKIRQCGYQRLSYEEEDGADDYGPSKYAFSLWEY